MAREGFHRSSRSIMRDGLSDLVQALSEIGRTMKAANRDVELSYQRTFFGPFWITISTAVFIVGYSVVGVYILKHDVANYLPFLVPGVVLWQYMTSSLNGATTIFNGQIVMLTAARMPVFALFVRFALRTAIQFLHSLPIVAIIAIIFVGSAVRWVEAIIGLAIVFFVVNCASLLIGTLSVWAHDLGVVVASIMQFMFYFSPVMWMPGPILHSEGWPIVAFNPLYYLLSIFRDPLNGASVPVQNYLIILLIAVVTFAVALITFLRARRDIPYAL